VAVLAAVALIGSIGATNLQQAVFAIGDPGLVPDPATGRHGRSI